MPRIVITHAVQDVDRWLGGRAERAAAVPGAGKVTDLVALDGTNHTGIAFDVDDVDALKQMLADLPPEVAAQAESHSVIPPMAVFVEAE
jgi:muconolactone delta-isomerase